MPILSRISREIKEERDRLKELNLSTFTALAVAGLKPNVRYTRLLILLRGLVYLLLDLQSIHSGSKLAEDLVGLLVEFQLGGDQISQVAKGLRGIKDLE